MGQHLKGIWNSVKVRQYKPNDVDWRRTHSEKKRERNINKNRKTLIAKCWCAKLACRKKKKEKRKKPLKSAATNKYWDISAIFILAKGNYFYPSRKKKITWIHRLHWFLHSSHSKGNMLWRNLNDFNGYQMSYLFRVFLVLHGCIPQIRDLFLTFSSHCLEMDDWITLCMYNLVDWGAHLES